MTLLAHLFEACLALSGGKGHRCHNFQNIINHPSFSQRCKKQFEQNRSNFGLFYIVTKHFRFLIKLTRTFEFESTNTETAMLFICAQILPARYLHRFLISDFIVFSNTNKVAMIFDKIGNKFDTNCNMSHVSNAPIFPGSKMLQVDAAWEETPVPFPSI